MSKTVRQGVIVQMDKSRTLRWTHAAVAEFEDEAFKILGFAKDNNAGIMQLLPMAWNKARIRTLAVKAALRHEEQDIDDDMAGNLLDAYADKGGSIDDLGIAMQEALRIAMDPSSLDAWKKSLKNLKKIQAMREQAGEMKVKKALETAEKEIKSLTKPEPPITSESSS